MVYNVEKMLKDNGDKVSGSEKSDVESALAQAKTVAAGQLQRGR
jgi:molecular chaperone DnaK